MTQRPLSAVVLAAAEDIRMKSSRPKPLHRLCGRPMVLHVVDALAELEVERVVIVVGHGAERVQKTLTDEAPSGMAIEHVEQHDQRGTGDALSVAMTAFAGDDDALAEEEQADVIVLPGDSPMLRPPTLAALVRHHRAADNTATVLTAKLPDPTGYGHVVRGKDERVVRIADDEHASPDEQAIDEVNTGVYVFRRGLLAPVLRRLAPSTAKGEYFLTDAISVLADAGYKVGSLVIDDPTEAASVNDRGQLAAAEAVLRDRINERWMRRGVNMLDPERTYVETTVELAPDVTLYPGTLLQGTTKVGEGAEIGPDARLVDCSVGAGARVEQVAGRQAAIGAGAVVGPFAVLRPGATVAEGEVVAPFTTLSAEEPDEPEE